MSAFTNDPLRWDHPAFVEVLSLTPRSRPAPAPDSKEAKGAQRVSRLISREAVRLVEATPQRSAEIARHMAQRLYCRVRARPLVKFLHQDGDRYDPGYRMTLVLRPLSCAVNDGPKETHGADLAALARLGVDLSSFHQAHGVSGDARFLPIASLSTFLHHFTRRFSEPA